MEEDTLHLRFYYKAKNLPRSSIEAGEILNGALLKKAPELGELIKPHFEKSRVFTEGYNSPRVIGGTEDGLEGEVLEIKPSLMEYEGHRMHLSGGYDRLGEIIGICREAENIYLDPGIIEPRGNRLSLEMSPPNGIEASRQKFDTIVAALAANGYAPYGVSVASPRAGMNVNSFYDKRVYDLFFGENSFIKTHSYLGIDFKQG